MKLSAILAMSACAGVLTACNPPPAENDYRDSVDLTVQYRNPPRLHPDRYFYQTEYIGTTTFIDHEGNEYTLAGAGCVELERELTEQDYETNPRVRVKFKDEETGFELSGTIEAIRLVRAEWRGPETCTALVLEGEMPANLLYRENPAFGRDLAPEPI